uniref:FBA domain-containing protein n=1 Tax=Panagrolaimus davidi TaxID=227884 RepID=A0A914RDI4_9BILA
MSETLSETSPSTVIDLSVANPDIIEAILLRLPGKEIIKCRKVCRKWNNITLSLSFWLSKEEYDGEKYIKSLINSGKSLLCEDYAILSVKKPFERNILFNSNPNGKNEVKKHADPRWNFSSPGWVYSSPPSFLPDNFHPEFDDLFDGCLETTSSRCDKTCIINIKEIGLSPHIMNLYRPPIIFSEWISNQTDCRSIYWATIRLLNERHQVIAVKEKEQRFEFGRFEFGQPGFLP